MRLRDFVRTCAPLAATALLACGGSAATTAEPEAPAPEAAAPVAAAPDTAATEARLREILAMPHRPEAERVRDVHRHPVETLTFFGIQPHHTVVELSPGGGWYTNLLGPLLVEKGKLIAVTSDPNGKPGYSRDNAVKLRETIAANKQLFGTTEATVMALLDTPPRIELGPDGSADAVLTFRNVHNWAKAEKLDAVLAASFKVLKPGGVLGVVDHRAKADAPLAAAMEAGYLPEAWVIERVTAAGFVLEGKSEVNANPRDSKDHPHGVWSLPPTLQGKDKDMEKFVAIGESDRMTLKFIKPAN
jgi:predicted methyltransferase